MRSEAVIIGNEKGMAELLEQIPVPNLSDPKDSDGSVAFYREMDYAATAYFYLDAPSHDLPPLPDKAVRTAGLPAKYEISCS